MLDPFYRFRVFRYWLQNSSSASQVTASTKNTALVLPSYFLLLEFPSSHRHQAVSSLKLAVKPFFLRLEPCPNPPRNQSTRFGSHETIPPVFQWLDQNTE